MIKIYIAYFIAVNITGFCMMGADKRRAKKGLWRISEKALFGAALLGGGIGTTLGMRAFHHKTRHWYFKYGMPLIAIAETALVIWLYYKFYI